MELVEKKIASEEIFSGRILHVHRDTVLLPNGKTAFREVADHPGGVAIVALTEQQEVFLVEQYRYAFSRTMVEIPAGKRETGEAPFLTAQRELLEEVGDYDYIRSLIDDVAALPMFVRNESKELTVDVVSFRPVCG